MESVEVDSKNLPSGAIAFQTRGAADVFIASAGKYVLSDSVLEGETITGLEELFVNDRVRARKVVQSPDGKLYLLTDEAEGKMILIERTKKK